MNVAPFASNATPADDMFVTPARPPTPTPSAASGSLTPTPRRADLGAVASTPYPAMPKVETVFFIRQMKAQLQSAARQDNTFILPALPPRTPGWRSPVLHSLMGAGAQVFVPPGATPPDESVANMRNATRTAIEYYLLTRDGAFDGLSFEGRKFARSAIVFLLDNVKQPAGTPGRLDESQIPVALQMIDNAAKTMTGRFGAPRTAATERAELPTRLQPSSIERAAGREAGLIMLGLNARPGNEPGMLDTRSWQDISTISDNEVRRQVMRQAFEQHREVLQQAYGQADWSAAPSKVLATTDGIAGVAAAKPHVFGPANWNPQDWQQVLWQQRMMKAVQHYQLQIDRVTQSGNDAMAAVSRAELKDVVIRDRANVARGNHSIDPQSAQDRPMVMQALRQFDQLLQQLDRGDGGPPRGGR